VSNQIAMDLAFPPAFGRADFIVDDSNAAALRWVEAWPDWPGPALVVCGPAGCGKTHLLRIWCERADAMLLDRPALAAGTFARDARALALDDADAMAGDRAAEENLFHLYNRLAGQRGSLLLAARSAPSRWPLVLRDLASRLRAAALVEIAPPSDQLLETIIAKLCSDRQMTLGPRVMQYVVTRMERSPDAARRLVAALDRQALAARGPVTVERARAVLAAEGMDG
jgi:DnaA regulatory inactivator Hda